LPIIRLPYRFVKKKAAFALQGQGNGDLLPAAVRRHHRARPAFLG
jgi:hypothetical protein